MIRLNWDESEVTVGQLNMFECSQCVLLIGSSGPVMSPEDFLNSLSITVTVQAEVSLRFE